MGGDWPQGTQQIDGSLVPRSSDAPSAGFTLLQPWGKPTWFFLKNVLTVFGCRIKSEKDD